MNTALSYAQFPDIDGHWAENELNGWLQNGLLKGGADGSVRPDDSITRAEFLSIISRVFNYVDESSITLPDVPSGKWYAKEVSRAYAAGIVKGDRNSNIMPDKSISRQEAAVILYRAFDLEVKGSNAADKFNDAVKIAGWACEAVAAMVENDYISGRPGNLFAPEDKLTRAEAVKMINNVMGELKNAPGTYTGDAGGNVVVNTAGVVLKDMTIAGSLYLAQGIGEGEVTLDNVIVKGKTFVRGGGENSIILKNTSLEGTLVVIKKGGLVRIVAKGSTNVENIKLNSGAKLEEEGVTENGFGNLEIITVASGEKIRLNGEFESVSVEVSGVNVEVADGTVRELNIREEGDGTQVVMGGNAEVTNLNANADIDVKGSGRIKKANIKAGNASFEEEPEDLDIIEGATAKVGGKDFTVSEPVSNPGSNNSSEDPGPAIPMIALNVSDAALTVGDCVYAQLTVNPADAVLSFSSNDSNVVSVNQTTGEMTAVSEGTAAITVSAARPGYRSAGKSFNVTVLPQFAVTSASGTNLAEIVVKFNKELDESTVLVDHFIVEGVVADSVFISDDSMTVTLTINKAVISPVNGADYAIEVTKDVKDVAGNSLAKAYSTTINIFDTIIPVVTEINLTGPRTFEILFSEPVETGDVSVENGKYLCFVGEAGSNKVVVTFAVSMLIEGNYDVEVSGFKDYAGHSISNTDLVLAYIKDNTPITAVVTESSQTEVKVVFNKPVKLTPDYSEYFYHTFSSWKPESAVSENGTGTDSVWTLDFKNNPIHEGSSKLVIRHNAIWPYIEDEWGNKLTSNISIQIDTAVDNEPPSVTGINVMSESEIQITFSEHIQETIDQGNIRIKNADGDEVNIDNSYFEWNPANLILTIELNDMLDAGIYTITFKSIKDASINENEMAETTMAFTIVDVIPIDITKVVATAVEKEVNDEKDIIYVKYPEKMNISVLDKSMYQLKSSGDTVFRTLDYYGAETVLELFGLTGRVVKITIPKADEQVVKGAVLRIGKVADLAGNEIEENSFDVGIVTGEPVVTDIEQTDANKLTFKFDKALSSVLLDAFIIAVDEIEYTPAALKWSVNTANDTTAVEVFLDGRCVGAINALDSDYSVDTGLILTDVAGVRIGLDGKKIESEFGFNPEDVYDFTAGSAPVIPADMWAASYQSMTVTQAVYDNIGSGSPDTRVSLKFSEPLSAEVGQFIYTYDLIVKKTDGDVLTSIVDYFTEVIDGILVVYITDVEVPLEENDAKYSIQTKDSITYIKGSDGNRVNAFSEQEIKNP